ncbi:10 kDa chaperonin [Rickettsiales bacterium]|nr:10 kDa chaperonin [Rickettsiales bacterium]
MAGTSISELVLPLEDRVLIEPQTEDEEAKTSRIILPETAKDKPIKGKIVAVGPGARDSSGKLIEMNVEENDMVMYGKWAGQEVKIDEKIYIIVKQSELLLKFLKSKL